jgi:hypothetical protein
MRPLYSYFPPESHTVGAVPSGCQRSYVAMLAAVVLDERSRGESLNDIERRWLGLVGVGWHRRVVARHRPLAPLRTHGSV